MLTEASIRSARDGSELIFSDVRRSSKGALLGFAVIGRSANLQCSVAVDADMSDTLPGYFAELEHLMANFKGWKGVREWPSLEGELAISATADSLGHVTAIVVLKSGHYELDWKATLGLLLEAGQLGRIAKDIEKVFEAHAT